MFVRRFLPVAVASAAIAFVASNARADEAACIAASENEVSMRKAGRLQEALKQLAVCAAPTCSSEVNAECTKRIGEVKDALPTVVVRATDSGGNDLTDVKVSMDGASLVTKLDGLAVDVDPGAHTFLFEAADGKTEQKVVITEGGKAQRITAAFGAAGTAPVATTPGVATSGQSAAPSSLTEAKSAPAAAGEAPAKGASGSSKFDFLPKEPVESGVSVGFRIGYALPYGNATGGAMGNLSNGANGQIPFWFDVGYLVNPYLYLGAHFSYGIVLVPGSFGDSVCSESAVSCTGGDVRLGADLQWRFLGTNVFQPWIGLSFLGYERIHGTLTNSNTGASATQAFDGIEWVTPQVGFDYKIVPAISAGLFAGISLSQYLGTSVVEEGQIQQTSMDGNPLHGWVFFGARVNYDLHL